MDYAINFNGKDYKFKKINDFTFAEYNKLNELISNEQLTLDDIFIDMIFLFSGLQLPHYVKRESIMKIDWKAILKEEIKFKKIKKEWKEYTLIDINKIKIGRFIDLEYFLIDKKDKIEYIIALVLLPDGYTLESLEKLVEIISDKMEISLGIFFYDMFINFRTDVYKNYNALFSIVETDEEETEETEEEIIDLGLMEFVYFLSGDNILSVDGVLEKELYEVLNYLSWQHQKTEKIKKQNKNISNP